MLKLLFPPVCLHCGELHEKLKVPLCAACVACLEVRVAGDILITFEGMGPVQSLMNSFKNGSSPHVASLLAAYMVVQYAQSHLPLPDIVTAVPSSRWRKWQVGQESAVVLAREFAKLTQRPFVPLLKRERQLLRQELLMREERVLLSPGEFQWKRKENLHGKTVLLIDDTITTGTTLACCARRLWEGGPAKIFKMACVDQGYLQE